MSVQVSYKKQFIFGFLFLLIILAIVEIIMRIYDYYQPNCLFLTSSVYEELKTEVKQEMCRDNYDIKWGDYPTIYLVPNQHLKTININEFGFRGPEFVKEKPDGVYRIFVIGGSTIFGGGSTSDSTTIPGYLQNLFDATNLDFKVEVINAGLPQAYSFTETDLVKTKLLEYDPDLLIIYDGWNDIERPFHAYDVAGDYQITDKILRAFQTNDYFKAGKVIQKIYFSWHHNTNSTIKSFDNTDIDKKVLLWKKNWGEICELANKNNFDIVITLQPLVGTESKNLTKEEIGHFVRYDLGTQATYYEKYNYALNELTQVCTKTADLRNTFDNETGTIFFDAGHVGDKGNKIIAEKLYQIVLPIISKKLV